MDLSNLNPAEGSVHGKGKRVGRGQGSGKGGNVLGETGAFFAESPLGLCLHESGVHALSGAFLILPSVDTFEPFMSVLRYMSVEELEKMYKSFAVQYQKQVITAQGNGQSASIAQRSVEQIKSQMQDVLDALQLVCPEKYPPECDYELLDFRKESNEMDSSCN